MKNATLELNETTASFSANTATPMPLQTGSAVPSDIKAPGRRKLWKSRMPDWLLPPLAISAICLLVKAGMVAGDVLSMLNAVYAAGLN